MDHEGGDIVELPRIECYCHHHCPPGLKDEGICSVPWGGKCFAAVEEVINPATGNLEAEYSYGCFSPGDPSFLQCKGHLVDHSIPTSILCCENRNLCNEDLKPQYTPTNITDPSHPYYGTTHSDYFLIQILLGAIFSFLLLTFCVVLYIVCKYRAREKRYKTRLKGEEGNKLVLSECPNSRDCEMNLIDVSSGSGSGLPLLKQRTIGMQIVLRSRIGKGRYGEVFLGDWGGGTVAVKSFHTLEDASWEREKQIYQLALMKHPNILVSLAWDIRSVENVTRMIIVTDYHPNGSLYDYLETRCLKEEEALRLLVSSTAGLCHLHTEIEGKPYKPGIAHRDIKSKNILIKRNGEAVIADFGLSVCSVLEGKGVDRLPLNIKSGTKRYMPPEILDDTMKIQWFESYKQADMYSFALILWEIGSRTLTSSSSFEKDEVCEVYQVPYYNFTSSDPSYEEMKSLICDKAIRPTVPERWMNSTLLRLLVKVIQECWHPIPHVRPSSLRLKKTFFELKETIESPCSPPPHLTFQANY